MADAHTAALEHRLHAVLGPLMTIERIRPAVAKTGAPYAMTVMSPDATGVNVTGTGWGRSFEHRDIRILTGIDRTMDPEDSADAAIAVIRKDLDRMEQTRKAADAAGLTAPLVGDEIESTAHLRVDADAMRALIGLHGSLRKTRFWLRDQMALHRRRVERDRTKPRRETSIHIELGVLEIPFRMLPLRVDATRGAPDPGTIDWCGEMVRMGATLPRTVEAISVGRTFGSLVEGTPVGSRIVMHIDVGDRDTIIRLEPDMVRVDEALPA